MTVPPFVQALLSVVLTVGISVVLVWACHRQLLVLSEEPKHSEDDPTPKPPAAYYLSGRIIQVTSLGFVFLFTFTVGQFMLNARSADNATQMEAQYFSRALVSAQELPADMGRDRVVEALSEYRAIVVDQQWPLMERGDSRGAYDVQTKASTIVGAALGEAQDRGAADTPNWDILATSVDEMFTSATDRLGDVPRQHSANLVLTALMLGIVSLAMTAIFQPARLGMNIVLIGIMAAVYGILFYMVVELSNPFQGSGALTPLLNSLP